MLILSNSVVPFLLCHNNCYSFENNNKYPEHWCDKFNLPVSGKCQTNDTEGCIRGHIEISDKVIYFQTCQNKSPVNFGFSQDGNCTEYSNSGEDNVLYYPIKNATRATMKFRACKCFSNMCN
uniref:Uncharacterized protein n=1 Tax=Strongyloides venezuelensis TaxID=75913 RepID=A0A0K0EUV0_STRVS